MSHPIWSWAERKQFALPRGISPSSLAHRRTGATTIIAFQTFAECYINPDTWIKIVDHSDKVKEADRFLFERMREMAADLKYEFDWNRQGNRYYIMLRVGTKK